MGSTPRKTISPRRPIQANATIPPSTAPIVPSAALARVVSITDDGTVNVVVGNLPPVAALVAHHVPVEHLHRALSTATQVVVVSLDGDPRRPVIIGSLSPTIAQAQRPTTAKVDGRRVELTGQDEVVLTCGKASITLTRAGKVIIKGTYVSSGSQGVHRITGGSVQIN